MKSKNLDFKKGCFDKIPFRVIINNILIFYNFWQKRDTNILEFYGYFKLDYSHKIFCIWKSCYFECITSEFLIPKNVHFLNLHYGKKFVGNGLPNIKNLTVYECPLFIGNKIQTVETLSVWNCPKFIGDKLPNIKKLCVLYAPLFIGDKIQTVETLEIFKSPLFVGDKLPNIKELHVCNCEKFCKDKVLNIGNFHRLEGYNEFIGYKNRKFDGLFRGGKLIFFLDIIRIRKVDF